MCGFKEICIFVCGIQEAIQVNKQHYSWQYGYSFVNMIKHTLILNDAIAYVLHYWELFYIGIDSTKNCLNFFIVELGQLHFLYV